MLDNKEFNQAEELSKFLDDLNDGKHPITQDKEIKELVEMAHFVKQSYSQGEVPRLLIGELADHLAAEFKAQKRQKRRTHWLYGGLVGTAAAVLIAAFVQLLLPQSTDHNIAQQLDDSIVVQKNVAVAEQSDVPIILQATDAMIGQQFQSGSSVEAPARQSVEKKTADDISQVIPENIQGVKSPDIDQKSTQVAMLQQENLKDMMTTKSRLMTKMNINSLREDEKSQLASNIAILVLPNQTTQSITVDHTSGVVRQVYNQGTHDEIIITQRPLAESMTKTVGDAKQGEMQAIAESAALQTITRDTKDTSNRLTVKIDQYNITIEGKKTKADLQKLAESLTVMK